MLNSPSARFQTVAIVGAGLMGRRLAAIFASQGMSVRLTDTNLEILGAATDEARDVARQLSDAPGDIHGTPDLKDAVLDVDYVTEAIVENLEIKKALFAELSVLAPTAVLASNSSVLPVSAIAAGVTDPERAVGTHWWNPPDLIPIVEVIQGDRTSVTVVEDVMALMQQLGKLPVWVRRDVPGFVGNRLQHALWREAIALVHEGVADAETVDLVVRNTIGLRLAQMGPLENADYVGLDLTQAIHEAVFPALDRSATPSALLQELVTAGNLGAKSGRGFLEWPPGSRESAGAALAAHVAAEIAHRRSPEKQEEQS